MHIDDVTLMAGVKVVHGVARNRERMQRTTKSETATHDINAFTCIAIMVTVKGKVGWRHLCISGNQLRLGCTILKWYMVGYRNYALL